MKKPELLFLLVLTLFMATPVEAEETRVDAIAYAGSLDYDNSIAKDNAAFYGIYGYFGFGLEDLVEVSYDELTIDLVGGGKYTQRDYTTVYSNFSVPNWKFRFGGHIVSADGVFASDGWTGIVGAHYYELNKWDVGADIYYSKYADAVPEISALQFTPHIGYTVTEEKDFTFRTDLTGYWVHLDDDIGLGRQDFRSVEQRLTFYWQPWTFSAYGWSGTQAFAVRDGGFTVYNLAERHTGGYGADIKIALEDATSIRFKYTRELFNDIAQTADSNVDGFSVSLGHSF